MVESTFFLKRFSFVSYFGAFGPGFRVDPVFTTNLNTAAAVRCCCRGSGKYAWISLAEYIQMYI